MTRSISTPRTVDDAVAAARAHIEATALRPTPDTPRQVGLELEFHLVDLAAPARRPSWDAVQRVVAALPPMPAGSSVTTEPGGQLELSTPPAVGVTASLAALQADHDALRTALHGLGYGAAALGADPVRPPERVNPSPRYAAMQQHFAAVGCAGPGTAMMTATAALQVNLDAGPAAGWSDRVRLAHALGPVLVAVSANSPFLGGEASGWASMRQQAWHGIDGKRSGPVTDAGHGGPAAAWATYALEAPVMLVHDVDGGAVPLTGRVTFADWLRGAAPIDRAPTEADLDYHLTTLFPPVRPRGYLEIRCLDAVPARWWPALAALTATVLDHPVAADLAAEAVEPLAGGTAWLDAARDGLADTLVARAARRCVDAAVTHCEPGVRPHLDALADLVHAGRSPGHALRERAASGGGPLAVLEEAARD